MAARDIAAVILFDPVNIRYASGARNMQIFTSRNPGRYLWLPVEGDTILFEFTGAEHLGEGIETVDEVRPAITASYVAAGPAIQAVVHGGVSSTTTSTAAKAATRTVTPCCSSLACTINPTYAMIHDSA